MNATVKPLTMATIKASIPDYFGATTFDKAYDNAYSKGAALEAFAQVLAGNAVERAYSGNDAGIAFLRVKVESLTLAKKHALASKLRSIKDALEGIKGQSLKSADIGDYEAYADNRFCEFLAALVPPKTEQAPKEKAPSYKALYEAKSAEYDALKIDFEALQAEIVTLREASKTPATV